MKKQFELPTALVEKKHKTLNLCITLKFKIIRTQVTLNELVLKKAEVERVLTRLEKNTNIPLNSAVYVTLTIKLNTLKRDIYFAKKRIQRLGIQDKLSVERYRVLTSNEPISHYTTHHCFVAANNTTAAPSLPVRQKRP